MPVGGEDSVVIYLDIILLLNFAIDALLIWFTAFFRKERVVWWRILLAAGVGTSYIAFYFTPSFAGLYQWFVKLFFSILMLLLAFGFRRIVSFLQTLCIFYFVAFVFGGGVFALEYFLTPQSEVINGILVTQNDGFGAGTKPTVAILLVGFLLVIFLSRKSYRAIQEPRRLDAFLAEVAVVVAGESVLCRGLIDTGNQLHEPITRIPVMVIESSLFAHILPAELLAQVSEKGKLESMERLYERIPDEWLQRIRVIPYRSVSAGMDFLLAIKPDRVIVTESGNRYETHRVLIGLNPFALSPDGKYQAIVHPALMELAAESEAKSFQ